MRNLWMIVAALAVAFTSCQSGDDDHVLNGKSTFTASFESNDSTRAYLGDDEYCYWETNDEVSVFNNAGTHYQYASTKGDVIITELATNESTEFLGENIYAIFPYDASNKLVGNELHSSLPAEQKYNAAKTDLNSAIMVSKIAADATKFAFKNSCALVKYNLKTTKNYADKNIQIKAITIESKSKQLAGDVKIGSDYVATISNGTSNSVVMTGCEAAGALTTEYKSFVVAIPAGAYGANDLTVKVETSDPKFDYETSLKWGFNVKRSEYVALETTLVNADDKVEYANKAIMADKANLTAQGFTNQDKVDVEFELPTEDWEHDFNNKVYTFKTLPVEGADKNVYVINTFTTTQSGINGVAAPTVTVKNLTITGTLRGTNMGIYVKNGMTGTNVDAKAFNTVFENVHIVNNNICPWTKDEGTALGIFGNATLNNCEVYGTRYDDEYSQSLYDISARNGAVVTINGGKYGFIQGKEQSELLLKGGVNVEGLYYFGIYSPAHNILGKLVIEDVNIEKLYLADKTQYNQTFNIKSGANIKELHIIEGATFVNSSIEDGANIGKVFVGDVEMTLEEFKATLE